jgi:hypothetical protein
VTRTGEGADGDAGDCAGLEVDADAGGGQLAAKNLLKRGRQGLLICGVGGVEDDGGMNWDPKALRVGGILRRGERENGVKAGGLEEIFQAVGRGRWRDGR